MGQILIVQAQMNVTIKSCRFVWSMFGWKDSWMKNSNTLMLQVLWETSTQNQMVNKYFKYGDASHQFNNMICHKNLTVPASLTILMKKKKNSDYKISVGFVGNKSSVKMVNLKKKSVNSVVINAVLIVIMLCEDSQDSL